MPPPKGSVSQHLHLGLGFQPMTLGGGGHTAPQAIAATLENGARSQEFKRPLLCDPATPLLRDGGRALHTSLPASARSSCTRDPNWEPPRHPPAGADSPAVAGIQGAVRGAERPWCRAEGRASEGGARGASPSGPQRRQHLGLRAGSRKEELLVCPRTCEQTVGAAPETLMTQLPREESQGLSEKVPPTHWPGAQEDRSYGSKCTEKVSVDPGL